MVVNLPVKYRVAVKNDWGDAHLGLGLLQLALTYFRRVSAYIEDLYAVAYKCLRYDLPEVERPIIASKAEHVPWANEAKHRSAFPGPAIEKLIGGFTSHLGILPRWRHHVFCLAVRLQRSRVLRRAIAASMQAIPKCGNRGHHPCSMWVYLGNSAFNCMRRASTTAA